MNKRLMVIIDDGHGIDTPGKRSPVFTETTQLGDYEIKAGKSFLENYFNRAVAEILETELKQFNIISRILKPELHDITLEQRVKRQRDFYTSFSSINFQVITISIHANAFSPTEPVQFNQANGLETYFRKKHLEWTYNELSERLAGYIQKNTLAIAGQRDRGIKDTPQFYILRNSYGPAVLFESGFMTNRKDLELLATRDYQIDTAKAIRDAVIELQGTTYIGNLDPKTERKI